MAKYDDPEVLDAVLHNLERITETMQSFKQDKIRTVKAMPSSSQIRKEEIQMLDEGETVKLVFRNTDGTLFTTSLTKEE